MVRRILRKGAYHKRPLFKSRTFNITLEEIKLKDNIKKLLADKSVSNYRISKDTGIAQATLSDYASGKSDIGNMKLDHALKLNEYYLKIREEFKMKNFKHVGNWWADKGIELVEIEGTVYGLNGWNGEKYTESFKVTDADHTEASEEEYSIVPQYEEIDSEYHIVGYEVE